MGTNSADPIRAGRVIAFLSLPGNEVLSNVEVGRRLGVNEVYIRTVKHVFRWGFTMKIDPRKLRLDGGTQPRAEMDESLIREYAEKMSEGVPFIPPTVFHDGVNYWVADGFHRTQAAIRAGLKKLDVDVHQGDLRMAVLHSVGANATHGLRRSNADKRRAVLTLLNDEEWHQWSDSQIARRCSVTDKTVSALRPQSIFGNSEDTSTRKATRNGTEYSVNTTKIGPSRPAPVASVAVIDPPYMEEDREAELESPIVADRILEVVLVMTRHTDQLLRPLSREDRCQAFVTFVADNQAKYCDGADL